ncbi:hypothetical protein RRG08_007277 [Elysia crispata]|uniref:Uncharacterized protein n=1 Tax=Elysia crispata TaxID=231223 RepID=A0AAE0ZT56_9GAST|nr:hypothetical protein RRG08_007277 [Elysia crispata]
MSNTDSGSHARLESFNSLAPLLSSDNSETDFSSRLETDTMPQEGFNPTQNTMVINSSISQPPQPHSKSQPRVFSKKTKGITQKPVPILPTRNRGGLDLSRSRDSEGWEMSPKGRTDSDLRSGPPESPTSPPVWCLSSQFDDDPSQEEQSCSYLKPIDSPISEHPGMFPFADNHPGSPEAHTGDLMANFQDKGDKGESRRFDSGIGDSECELASQRTRTISDSPSLASAQSSYPRLSRMVTHYEQHYEDIDAYKKCRNGSNGARRPANGMVPHGVPRLPGMNISGITNGESNDHDTPIATSQQNCVVRPYTDARTGSLPHTYSHLETNGFTIHPKTKNSVEIKSWWCCLLFGLVLVFLMSASALGLGIYLLLNDSREFSSASVGTSESSRSKNTSGLAQSVNVLEGIIGDLQKDVTYLKKENANLSAELAQITDNVKNKIQPLFIELSHLRITQRDTIQSISAMDDRLTTEIANISLTPGPQGPVGVADFSLCIFRSNSESAVASNRYPTESQYTPTDQEVQDYVAIFAYCSMKGAQTKQLEIKGTGSASISGKQYRCVYIPQIIEAGQSQYMELVF